ncbi:MAG: DNA cytosine methyltransferase, partial [bacterium]|nr:DNA cytosine methyltransferase [bacterium]
MNMNRELLVEKRIIYDLCGGTGAWSRPYREAGYDVRVIDIKNGDDVRLLIIPKEPVYGVLAATDCTHFSNSGARWWKEKGENALLEGLSIADACIRFAMFTNPHFWVLENPVGRLVHYIGPPVFKFDPCDFGDPYTKRTYLWGKFNEPVKGR